MHYPLLDLADFAFILIVFVLPSLFSSVTGTVSVPTTENHSLITAAVYILLTVYMIFRYHTSDRSDMQKTMPGRKRLPKAALFISCTLTAFILLCLVNFIITKLAYGFSGISPAPAVSATPETMQDKLILVLWVILLASFEEFTYRWLLPTRLRSLWADRRPVDDYTGVRTFLSEAAIICLFALCHRYMGWWAVLNALLAGIVLRTRFFMTGSVYPALIAHILYNLTAFYGILNA